MMRRWLLCGLLAGAAALAWAQETGTLIRATELRAEPFADAKAVAALPAEAPVEIVRRQGAWMEVKAKEGQGWLRLLAVRPSGTAPARPAASGGKGESAALSLLGLGPAPSSQPAVATGVRGLSADDLKNARPNPAEFEKLGRYAVSPADAQRFAGEASLAPRSVPYLAPGGGEKGAGQ